MKTFIESERSSSSVKLQISIEGKRLSFREVFELWQTDNDFTDFYAAGLLHKTGNSFFWEHPPLFTEDLDNEYEVTLRKAKSFDRKKLNEDAFREHFEEGKEVVAFDNLGKSARLVVPVKIKEGETYKHLGAFLQNGSPSQIMSLFKETGIQIDKELRSGKQIWLSTAGLGVSWLHVRLDIYPKYYKTNKYREADFFQRE